MKSLDGSRTVRDALQGNTDGCEFIVTWYSMAHIGIWAKSKQDGGEVTIHSLPLAVRYLLRPRSLDVMTRSFYEMGHAYLSALYAAPLVHT
jgi:hypothetical protein